jgi:hypothetical protein
MGDKGIAARAADLPPEAAPGNHGVEPHITSIKAACSVSE